MKETLKKAGWHTWYRDDYWVHPDSVERPDAQDYTNYGMSLEDAISYEALGKPKHRFLGIPILSQMELAARTKGLTK